MPPANRPTVYSTDPEPEAAPKPIDLPRNPAAPFNIQGNNPVRVRIDRKGRGGKVVSVIDGILSPEVGKKALLKHLKSNLGTGGALKDGLIEIQGDQRAKIVDLLNALGYRAKSAGG